MLENYEKLAKLGDGAQGSVYKVRHRTTKKEFALKMIRCRDSAQANLALKEIKVLIQLRHPAIVTYSDFFLDFDTRNPKEMLVCLVMELCEEKHFEQLIKSTKSEMMMSGKHPIPEDVILSWISQAAHALQYIHEKGFMHRDLKPSNIFFAANEGEEEGEKEKGARRPSSSAGDFSSHFRYPRQLKLGDFGLATAAHPNGDLNKSTVGTPYYFAPEQMLRQKYDNKVDIWALGSVMLELICLRDRPINSEVLERPEVVDSVVGDINRMGFSKGLAVIIRDMLCRHPASRPTSAVLVERVRSLRSAPSSRIVSAITSRNVSHNNSGCEDSLLPTTTTSGPLQSSSTTITTTTAAHIRQCEMCTAKPAKFICGDCGESFCSECDAVQHRVSTRSRHRRTEIVLPPSNTARGATVPTGSLNGLSREIEARLVMLQLAPIPCQMCEEDTAAVLCPQCDSEAYCKKCDELKHINPRRRLHERHVILHASSSVAVRTPTFVSAGSFAAGLGGGPSAPSSRKNSPKADPLAATLAGGMVIKGSFSASIINTTTIIPPPLPPMTATMATGAAARRVSASAFTTSALEIGGGRLGIGTSDTTDGAPEPNVGSMAPVAEPKLGLSPTRSLAASTIFGCPSADVTTFAGNPPKSRNASPVRSRSASMSMGVGTNTLVATLRSNSEYPSVTDDHDVQNPNPMPRQCPPKRTVGSSYSSLAAEGSGGVPPLSIRVPSDDCPTLEEALAAIAAAVEQRKLAASRAASEIVSGALPSAPPLRNDRIVVVGDLTVSSPLTIPFPVDIIGRMAAQSGTGSPVDAGETPTLVFACTPAFTLSGNVVTAGSPTSSSSTSTPTVPATYNSSAALARGTTNVFCGMLANLNIRHDSADFPPTVNRAKVAAIIVDGGHWRVERCRLSSVSGHGLIAEGPEACARVIDCAVISTKLCGIMLLNGTAGEVCNTHVVGAKQTGVLVRKNVTTRLKKNQIKQNGETGVYIVDAKPVVEENDISNNNGCGVVVKGEDAAPTIRENTIAMNTQAGIFYCDGAKGAACDNLISENQRAGVLIKTQASPTITRNIVRKSKETGVYCFEGGRGTITHNTITDNLNAGVLVTTGANVNVSHNRIHKNYYEALWICKNGSGTFQNNDLRGNRKGPKDVEEGSQVAMAGNLES